MHTKIGIEDVYQYFMFSVFLVSLHLFFLLQLTAIIYFYG